MIVDIIDCDSGDWTVIKVDGEILSEGHSISVWDVCDLIERLGHTVKRTNISDSDMEEGNY